MDRRYKKFTPPLQQKVQEEAKKLSGNPYHYEELTGPLKGVRSYHFKFKDTTYRILEDEKRIEIVLVKTRERFYETLSLSLCQRR